MALQGLDNTAWIRRRSWRQGTFLLAVVTWFFLGHIHMVWPVPLSPSSLIPGVHGDNMAMYWNLAHMRHSVGELSLGFKTDSIFYPQGFHFLYHTHFYLDGLLLGLFQWVPGLQGEVGLVRSYNLLQMVATVLTGLGAWLGLRLWGVRDGWLRLALASAITFCGFRVFAVWGHQHFHSTHWMIAALVAAGFWRLSIARRRFGLVSWVIPAVLGVLTGAAFLNDATVGVFLLVLLGPIILGLWLRALVRGGQGLRVFGQASVVLGISACLAILHLKPIAGAIRTGLVEYVVPGLDNERISDLTSLVMPPNVHIWGGDFWTHLRKSYGLKTETYPYLGTGFLLLCLGGLGTTVVAWMSRLKCLPRFQPRRRLAIGATGVGLFLLLAAFGERWTIGQHQAPFRSPTIILRSVPIVNNIRMPYRWAWPGILSFSVGLGLLLDRRRPRRSRGMGMVGPGIYVVIAAVALLESRYRDPQTTDLVNDPVMNSPGLAQAVRKSHTGGSIATVPHWDMVRPMRWQVQWGMDIPLASGYVARTPPHGRTPVRGPHWTPVVEQWFRDRKVSILIITAAEPRGTWDQFADAATKALPGLRVIREADFSDPWNGAGSGFDGNLVP